MTNSLRLRAARGFTLIELLIVVIIIAILAAIAIPQFSSSSADAQESALDANLATVRSSIELYRVQHANVYPGVKVSSGGSTCTGTAGTGAVNSKEALNDQLTAYSNATGATCTLTSKDFPFGPYVRAIPAEPISNKNDITVFTTVLGTPATAAVGWAFSTVTGQFAANNPANDSKGKALASH